MTLSWLLGLPLLGALLIFLSPREKSGRFLAFGVSLLTFLVSLKFYFNFDPFDGGFQFQEKLDFGAGLGFHDSMGLDGVSLWFILLTAFLTPLCVAGDSGNRRPRGKVFYACLLILEAGAFGAFSAGDLFWFFLCWECMLVVFFYLFRFFGSARRAPATFQFVFFMMGASLLLLLGFLQLVGHVHSFDYSVIFNQVLPDDLQFWCFLALAGAFLIQIPVPPFHSWMADLYAEAPIGGAFFLAAIFSSLGIYGFIRYEVPLFPSAALIFDPWFLGLGLAVVVYGNLRAAIQGDARRLAASFRTAQVGWILLGLFCFSMTGFEGALLETMALAVSSGTFFIVLGMIERRGGKALERLAAGTARAPRLALALLAALLGLAAVPGLGDFSGIFLILVSLENISPLWGLAAAAAFVFSIWPLTRLFGIIFKNGAAIQASSRHKIEDLTFQEALLLLPFFLASMGIGLYPGVFLQPMEKTVQLNVLQRLNALPAMMDFAAQQHRLQDEKR
ncbi:MAG: complex I subunit 4 family protein [bacterium]